LPSIGQVHLLKRVNKTMKLIQFEEDRFFLDIEEIAEGERLPMPEVPEYKQINNQGKKR
jgi:hypothetical protein